MAALIIRYRKLICRAAPIVIAAGIVVDVYGLSRFGWL